MELRKPIKFKNDLKVIETRQMTCTEVYEQFNRLVYKIALTFENSGMDIDDIVQIGNIGLIKTFNTYDIETGFMFATLLGRVVTNEILMAMRKERTRKKNNIYMVSFEEPISIDECGSVLTLLDILEVSGNVEETVLKKLDIKNIIFHLKGLDPRLLQMFKLSFIDGIPQKDISKIMNISQSYVSRLLAKIPKDIRKKCGKLEKRGAVSW